MKRIYIYILLFSSITIVSNAQSPLQVNAGNDTLLCINGSSQIDSIRIGGNPTSHGGVAPYSYEWKLYSKSTKNESFLLKDNGTNTHVSNPYLKSTIHFTYPDTCGEYLLKVTVTDANNTIATDSSIIKISINMIGDLMFYPSNWDSITISPMIEGGIHPLLYSWTPTIGLSNPNIQNPKAKRMSPNISYSLEITDSYGCKFFTPNLALITDIKNGDLNTGFISYQNPVGNNGLLHLTSELFGSVLQVTTNSGKQVLSQKVETENIAIGTLIQTAGIYFYTLTTPQGKLLSGQFLRE